MLGLLHKTHELCSRACDFYKDEWRSGGRIQPGTSVDQYMARSIGRQAKVPSLVLGYEKADHGVHKR